MRLLLTLTLAFSLSTAFATPRECIKSLTNDYELKSRSFSTNTDSLEPRVHENDKLGQAFQVIRSIIQDYGCNARDVNFSHSTLGTSKSKCTYAQPERPASLGCYVETNLGYFFVHWDMGQTANVIYNIWD